MVIKDVLVQSIHLERKKEKTTTTKKKPETQKRCLFIEVIM